MLASMEKDGEAQLTRQILEHPVLHLEELAGAVGGLAKRDDPCLSDQRPEWTQVVETITCLRRLEQYGMATNPVDDGIDHLGM
jgi:hypothetical protein